jgi:hypothetical protein
LPDPKRQSADRTVLGVPIYWNEGVVTQIGGDGWQTEKDAQRDDIEAEKTEGARLEHGRRQTVE